MLPAEHWQAPVGYFDPLGMSKDGDEKTHLPQLHSAAAFLS